MPGAANHPHLESRRSTNECLGDLPIVGIVELADDTRPGAPSRPSLGSADGRGTVIGGARKSGALSRSISLTSRVIAAGNPCGAR